MTDQTRNVAMFAEVNGKRQQVGWATPADNGVRKTEKLPGFEHVSMQDVTFEDDETQTTEEETETDNAHVEPENENYPQAGDEGKDSAPLQVENNETVELNAGGSITDVEDADEDDEEDEEAAFQRELEEEQARLDEEANQAPQTRREARENNEESHND